MEVGHEVGVGERLVQNIIRAGLRVLKGDRRALERNVRDREVDIDLQKLVRVIMIMYEGSLASQTLSGEESLV